MFAINNKQLLPSGPAKIKAIMKLKEPLHMGSIKLTRIRCYYDSLAHMAFIAYNLEAICSDIEISFTPEHWPKIVGFPAFYQWLSTQSHWNKNNEFQYIPEVRKILYEKAKNNAGN